MADVKSHRATATATAASASSKPKSKEIKAPQKSDAKLTRGDVTAISASPEPQDVKLETTETKKPQKPDQEAYEKKLGQLEKEYNDAMTRYNAAKAKVEQADPTKNRDTPTQQRRQEIITQLTQIHKDQSAGKNTRTSKFDQIKRLDEQMRARQIEHKAAMSKLPFQTIDEIDKRIMELEREYNGGKLKLLDEKKNIAETSNLRRLKRNFPQWEAAQKGIDELKAKIKTIKDSLSDPQQTALSDQYNKLQAELDQIKAEQDVGYKNLNVLRDERSKLQAEQQEKFQAIRKLKDEYFGAKKAAAEYERQARNRIRERQRAEREQFELSKKKERAQALLEEASEPAYLEEIRRANSLLHYFDPTSASAEKAPLVANSGMTAEATRKVDGSALKGVKVLSKKDNDEFYMAAAKKGKKTKKGGAAASNEKRYNCPPSVIADCASMNINPPMTAADVPAVVEKVKAKLDQWKANQKKQTEENIRKAQKEIDRLEAEETDGNIAKVATPHNGTNGINGDKAETNGNKSETNGNQPETNGNEPETNGNVTHEKSGAEDGTSDESSIGLAEAKVTDKIVAKEESADGKLPDAKTDEDVATEKVTDEKAVDEKVAEDKAVNPVMVDMVAEDVLEVTVEDQRA